MNRYAKFDPVSICTGSNLQLKDGSCDGYEQSDEDDCSYLQRRDIASTFDIGRCFYILYEYIESATRRLIRRNPSLYSTGQEDWQSDSHHGDPNLRPHHQDSEDIDYAQLIDRLKNAGSKEDKAFGLKGWHGYIAETGRNAVMGKLVRRGIAPKTKCCGTCEHRTQYPERQCQLKEYLDEESGIPIDNPYFGKERLHSDDRCPGYKSKKYKKDEQADAHQELEKRTLRSEATPEEDLLHRDLFDRCKSALIDRAMEAKTTSKQKLYQEQYDLFLNICDLVVKGFAESDAISQLADDMIFRKTERDSARKKMKRWLEEVRGYLKVNVIGEV